MFLPSLKKFAGANWSGGVSGEGYFLLLFEIDIVSNNMTSVPQQLETPFPLFPFSNSHVQGWEPVFLLRKYEGGNFFERLLVKVFVFTKMSTTLILGRVLCSSQLLTCWIVITPRLYFKVQYV